MSNAYHNEALRKTRLLERKAQSMQMLLQGGQMQESRAHGGECVQSAPKDLAFSEVGHYQQMREVNNAPPHTNRKTFVRREKDTTIRVPTPESLKRIKRDQIYGILHPHKHNHWRIGPERDRKQYDHSRDGPVNDRTRYALRQEFRFLGNSLSMLKDDIRPAHKPIPVCRRF